MDYNNISDINMSDIEKSADYDNLVFSIISDKFRVLLIENSISEFINYKKLIQNFDCYLEVAYSGREGVHKYKYSSEGYYNLIIVDLHMAIVDGYTAIRNIRENIDKKDSKTIPIVGIIDFKDKKENRVINDDLLNKFNCIFVKKDEIESVISGAEEKWRKKY